ncbi:MAG TPA: DcaP family trimeric outer membrane transporter [Chryseolinea sp.]
MKPQISFSIILLIGVMVVSSISVNAQQTEQAEELPPGWLQVPKTPFRLKIGGYVKFDLIHDFNPINSPDFFDVSKIPTDGSQGESTHMHAKETRLFLDVRSPTKVGELRGYIEGDFYGTGGAFRLRHAYVEVAGKWLAGQTWSNFMDESMIPPTLDFEKPGAYAFARHALLRYKISTSKDAYLAMAVEEPSATAQITSGKTESPLPDFTARYRVTKPWGHLQLSGFAGKLRYRSTTNETQDVALYGGNLSGQLNVLKKDKLSFQVVYGPGVARYRGGESAVIDDDDQFESLTGVGYTVSYLHAWSPSFSSLAVYNYGEDDNISGQPFDSVSNISYLAVNLLWRFAENAFTGIEYLYGTREDIDGNSGSANRVQFSVSYSFNN